MGKRIEDTKAIRIYGPYYAPSTGEIVWDVGLPGSKKKRTIKTKFELLRYIDKITTNVNMRRSGTRSS